MNFLMFFLATKMNAILAALKKMNEIALNSSARFAMDYMENAKVFSNVWECRKWVISEAKNEGIYTEFGVADGSSLEFFALLKPKSYFYGFDSFQGLPEIWKPEFEKGRFSQNKLPIVPSNVTLVKGWFNETLKKFKLEIKSKNIIFLLFTSIVICILQHQLFLKN